MLSPAFSNNYTNPIKNQKNYLNSKLQKSTYNFKKDYINFSSVAHWESLLPSVKAKLLIAAIK